MSSEFRWCDDSKMEQCDTEHAAVWNNRRHWMNFGYLASTLVSDLALNPDRSYGSPLGIVLSASSWKILGAPCPLDSHFTDQKSSLRCSFCLWPSMSPTPFNTKSHCSGHDIYEDWAHIFELVMLPHWATDLLFTHLTEHWVSLPNASGSTCGCSSD